MRYKKDKYHIKMDSKFGGQFGVLKKTMGRFLEFRGVWAQFAIFGKSGVNL